MDAIILGEGDLAGGNMALTHASLAARLLRDAAAFFETIGEQNASLRYRMEENASVFRQVADLVENDPTGTLPQE